MIAAVLYWLIGRHLRLPPLVRPCTRCKGEGYDPKILDENEYPSVVCIECHGVGKELTETGRQVAEVDSVVEARVDAQLDTRYLPGDPNDPRRIVR